MLKQTQQELSNNMLIQRHICWGITEQKVVVYRDAGRRHDRTWMLVLLALLCPGNGFCRTPEGLGGFRTLDLLSWTSYWAKSWWYSEILWSFRTPTARSPRDRWTSLAPETCRVSAPVTCSAPPVATLVRNTRPSDQTSQIGTRTF